MIGDLSIETHLHWGRTIAHYPSSYSEKALFARLAAPISGTKSEIGRAIALDIMEEISMLGGSGSEQHEEALSRITLPKLESVLELTCFPRELGNFAAPKLIAGCIVLMSSVKPSPFTYEYGYLCFRLLLIALNTCLLKYGKHLDKTILIMDRAPLGHQLSAFWHEAAYRVAGEINLGNEISPGIHNLASLRLWTTPLLGRPQMDKLLNILHTDLKYFLAALRGGNSLGLSGLMYIMWNRLENEKACLDEVSYKERLFKPCHRVFSRFRLATSNFGWEPHVLRYLYHHAGMDNFQEEYIIDVDDSRNIIQAYIDYMESFDIRFKCFDINILMNIVAPLVAPGCEDLLPTVFETSVRVLWDSLSPGMSSHLYFGLVPVLSGILHVFREILERLKPPGDSDRAWIIDSIIKEDVVDLLIRVLLLLTPQKDDPEGETVAQDVYALARNFFDMTAFLPKEYLATRLAESAFCDWWKYLSNFAATCLLEPPGTVFSMSAICSNFLNNLFSHIWGDGWMRKGLDYQTFEFCRNPRCPDPALAKYTCPGEMGDTFCSVNCLAFRITSP
ncbi:unnamed protein product [Rhizoctonia solani]|uniref:Uncharacterized protein n=1 Tax=Rhizoctonia solani TaxID=456999 RepID=A0A8H2XIN8_9AGAM|nr:unnamed protein product [Rhizoctonia solani]